MIVDANRFFTFLFFRSRGNIPPAMFFDETLDNALKILQERGTIQLADSNGNVRAVMRPHPIDAYCVIPI